MSYCVLVKGSCRGRMCDFWARVRIRKMSIGELVDDARVVVTSYEKDESKTLRSALDGYWRVLGVMDMNRLRFEDPDLCQKIDTVEKAFLDSSTTK